MTFPSNSPTILKASGYIPGVSTAADFIFDSGELKWYHTDPQPTEQQIQDWGNDVTPLPSGQLFSQWQAEHGGDTIATAKRQMREALDDQKDLTRAGLHALVLLLLENLKNTAWVGNTAPTPAQAKTALRNKVDEIT